MMSVDGQRRCAGGRSRACHDGRRRRAAFARKPQRFAWRAAARIARGRGSTGFFPATFAGVTIQALTAMGHYGVNVAFSDGHARGIYPWSYLSELPDK